MDGLIFGGGGGGGEVEEGDHLSSEGFQMQKSENETENVKKDHALITVHLNMTIKVFYD